ncbi:hypothetical protein [Robbsia andropogonis]|uniref:hypothetical protein n=1 Tax=Robbsia andropogonis TaxID=28092 RepID=UPI002A6A27E5|nr:hypothetical protein [Robbsia andropogonis]
MSAKDDFLRMWQEKRDNEKSDQQQQTEMIARFRAAIETLSVQLAEWLATTPGATVSVDDISVRDETLRPPRQVNYKKIVIALDAHRVVFEPGALYYFGSTGGLTISFPKSAARNRPELTLFMLSSGQPENMWCLRSGNESGLSVFSQQTFFALLKERLLGAH